MSYCWVMGSGLFSTVLFILFMAFVFASLVGALIYANSTVSSPKQPYDGGAPTTMESSTTSKTATSSVVQTTFTLPPTTSTTTLAGYVVASYVPDTFYLLDNVLLNYSSTAHSTETYAIYVNGILRDSTTSESYALAGLPAGEYDVVIARKDFRNATLSFEVLKDTYSTARERTFKLSHGERLSAINAGKASIRFYDSAFCSICAAIRPRLNKLVDDNRECVIYEKLSAFQHPEEVIAGTLPTIVVQGKHGTFKANGQVSMQKISDMIERASGCKVN
jgi:hypothetical protein